LLSDSFNIAGNTCENRTVWIDSSGDYIASFTVSEGTIKGYPMTATQLSLWLEGTYEPDWTESNQADFGMSIDIGDGEGSTRHFVFTNDDSSAKEVHVEFSKVWEETNYVNLFGGAILVLLDTTKRNGPPCSRSKSLPSSLYACTASKLSLFMLLCARDVHESFGCFNIVIE
jgi:hypothetical protein